MRLEGRDRKLAIMAGVLVALWVGWSLLVGPALEGSARAREQIVSKERQLDELLALRARYDGLKARQEALDKRLEGRGRGFNITNALRGAANKAGMAEGLKGVTETPAVPEGRYRRRAAEVRLEGITLEELVSYLYEVENPAEVLRVDRLDVQPKADNPVYLDCSLTVSTIEAAPAPRAQRGGSRD